MPQTEKGPAEIKPMDTAEGGKGQMQNPGSVGASSGTSQGVHPVPQTEQGTAEIKPMDTAEGGSHKEASTEGAADQMQNPGSVGVASGTPLQPVPETEKGPADRKEANTQGAADQMQNPGSVGAVSQVQDHVADKSKADPIDKPVASEQAGPSSNADAAGGLPHVEVPSGSVAGAPREESAEQKAEDASLQASWCSEACVEEAYKFPAEGTRTSVIVSG